MDVVIGIKENDELSDGFFDSKIPRSGQAGVFFKVEDAGVRSVIFKNVVSAIGGGIIDNNYFVMIFLDRLLYCAPERSFNVVSIIVCGDDERNHGTGF